MGYIQAHAPHLKSHYIKIIQPFEEFCDGVKASPNATTTFNLNGGGSPLTPIPDTPLPSKIVGDKANGRARQRAPVNGSPTPASLDMKPRGSADASRALRTATHSSDQIAGASQPKKESSGLSESSSNAFKQPVAEASASRLSVSRDAPAAKEPAVRSRPSLMRASTVSKKPIYDSESSDLSDVDMEGSSEESNSHDGVYRPHKPKTQDVKKVTRTSPRGTKRKRATGKLFWMHIA